MRRLCGRIVCPRCVVSTARGNTCRCCAARAKTPSGAGQLPVSPPVHVRDRVPAVGPVGASKAGGAPHLVSPSVAVPKTPPKAPPATAGRLPPAEGTPAEEPEPTTEPRLAPTPKAPGDASRAPELPSGPKEKWLVKKERSRDRKRSGKSGKDRRRSRRGRSCSRRRRGQPSPCLGATGQSPRTVKGTTPPGHRRSGVRGSARLLDAPGAAYQAPCCDGRRWAGTGSTDPPGPPGSGGGGGDDGKGDGPKKKKNRPSQKQRKRLAAQCEAANRGADEEAGPFAEVKQEDPDYSGEELEELGGLARRVAVKASEAYARGTLASVRSRLRTWDAALRHLEKAGVVKRDPRPGFLTPAVLRKTVAYLYKSAALYGSAARLAKRQCDKGAGPRRGRQPVVFPPPRVTQVVGPPGFVGALARHGSLAPPPGRRARLPLLEWGTWCSSLWRGGLRRP